MRNTQVTHVRRGISCWHLSFPPDTLHGFSARLTSSSPGARSLPSPPPHSHTLISQNSTAQPRGSRILPSASESFPSATPLPIPEAHSSYTPLILSSKGGCGGAKFIERRLGKQGKGGFTGPGQPQGGMRNERPTDLQEAFGEEYRRGKKAPEI